MGVVFREHVEHPGGVHGVWTVVERQGDDRFGRGDPADGAQRNVSDAPGDATDERHVKRRSTAAFTERTPGV
jgi:hypothetical protein